MTHASGLQWTRTVSSLQLTDGSPIFVVRDEFAGANSAAGKVLSFNLMADGAVVTPSGTFTPPRRTYNYGGTPLELPSAGAAFNLAAGLNQLSFTGQNWNAHPTTGIDWDVYSFHRKRSLPTSATGPTLGRRARNNWSSEAPMAAV
jgi:hypothetical protein